MDSWSHTHWTSKCWENCSQSTQCLLRNFIPLNCIHLLSLCPQNSNRLLILLIHFCLTLYSALGLSTIQLSSSKFCLYYHSYRSISKKYLWAKARKVELFKSFLWTFPAKEAEVSIWPLKKHFHFEKAATKIAYLF